MGPLTARIAVAVCLCCASFAPALAQQRSGRETQSTLFSRAAIATLERKYNNGDVSYLLLDATSGALLSSHWEDLDRPIPLGSLVKPFTALAYAADHEFRYPKIVCNGIASGCWQNQPHGELDLTNAIAVSCNTYFMRLVESISNERESAVAENFGFESPNEGATKEELAGLGDRWRIVPVKLARAYLELFRRKNVPGVSPILEGMRLSALKGTGTAVDRQIKPYNSLVKTGTAPCTHAHWAPADGFVLAMLPAENPQILLLVRMHSITGAKAAETAGRMLHDMQE
jgi:hypothetical protein